MRPTPVSYTHLDVYKRQPEQCSDGIRYYREYYVNKGLFENSVYPGIEDMLRELKNAGKRLIVATSKPEEMAVRILEHFQLADCFERIAGASMDEKRVEKADVLRYVIEDLGRVDLTKAVMVEMCIRDRHRPAWWPDPCRRPESRPGRKGSSGNGRRLRCHFQG